MNNKININKIELEAAVKISTSFRQVAKHLGTNHQSIKKIIQKLEIDTSHFNFGRTAYKHIGKTYNLLTVKEVFKGDNGRWFCKCECKCGTKNAVKRLDGVTSGHIPSCGCAYLSRPSIIGSKNPAFTGCGELCGSRIYWIKRGAARRNIQFDVSQEYLWELFELQNKHCALSGMELVFGRINFTHETSASLDRIDSSKGYIEGNLQWVHKDVNKIKRDLNQDYFISLCHLISDNIRNKKH